jgi:hypothetical protein
MSIRIRATILRVEERQEPDPENTRGFGDNASRAFRSAGWFITFDNGLTIGIGHEKPDFKPLDTVHITITKV